jgi:hypothetical protein
MKDTSKEMDEVQMNDEGLDTSPTPLSASSTKVETVSAEEVDDDWSLYDTYSRDYRYIPCRDRKEKKKKRTNMFGESYYEPTTHTGYPTRHSVSTWASRGYFHGSVYSGGYSYGSSLLSSYSFYAKFDNLKTEREILSKGIVRVRELITVLNIPRRVYVKIKGDGVGDNSCSDTMFSGVDSLTSDESSVILYLQTKVLTDSSKTTEDKINIITAEGIHECAHILYTNNKILLDFIASLPKALSKFYGKLAEGDRKSDSDPDFGIEAKTVFEKRNTIYSEVTKLNEFFGQDRNGLRCEDYSTRTEAINCLKRYKSLYPEEYERGEKTAKCNLLLDPREDYSESVARVANIVLRDDLLKINRVIQLIVLFSTTIEDGRVETLLISERPGIKDYLSILSKYQEKHISDNLDASNVITDRELRSVIIDILRVIKGLKSPETKLEIEISEGILMEDSTSTYDSCRKAFKIYKKLEAWYQNESGPGPDKAETLADSFSVKNESNGLDRLIGMFLSPSSNLNDDSMTVEGDEELTIDTFYTKSMTDILNDNSSGCTLNKLDSIWTRLSKDISTSISPEIERSNSIISGILNESVEEVTSPYDSKKSTFFLKIKKVMKESPRTRRMMMLSSRVANYSSVLKKSILSRFKNEKFKFYGCKTGTLDPTKIVEAYQGVENVYTQPAAYETKKIVLSILLDESGSMDWKGRVDLVKQAAALLIQAFGDSEYVDLYIYGHTADIITGEETSVYVYKEGSEKGSKLIEDINKLSYVSAKSQNRDGTAIYEVAKRVNSKAFSKSTPDKDKKSIMIIMSDGVPEAGCYGGSSAIADTRKMVTKAQEEFGVSIIQCTINKVSESEEMFDTVIKLENDLPNFVQNLSNVIRRLLDEQIETKIRRF